LTYDDEVKMCQDAFDKGIVRLETEEFLVWGTAREVAEKLAGGLPSREDLVQSGVHAGPRNDFWMFVQRPDGIPDVIQLGRQGNSRYTSHYAEFGPCKWCDSKDEVTSQRPLTFIYALLDLGKNLTFTAPTDEAGTKIWAKYQLELSKVAKAYQDFN
jgi:hypothetical protein